MSVGIVAVGAGQACHQFVSSLRHDGYQGPVTLIGREPGLPYQKPPVSKEYLLDAGKVVGVELGSADHYRALGIDVVSGDPASAVDRATRTVHLASGHRVGYAHLVLATGVRPRRVPLPGTELAGVHTLSTRVDAEAIRARLDRCVSAAGSGSRLHRAGVRRECRRAWNTRDRT